jgi:hypothetical protein
MKYLIDFFAVIGAAATLAVVAIWVLDAAVDRGWKPFR